MFNFIPQNEYTEVLASADVALVTLEPGMEGLCVPSKFYSILASGRPTIALVSPESEVARVIDESGCGIHMAQGDAQRLGDVLCTLSQDPKTTDEMGRRARTVLEDRYSTRRVAAHYYRVMQAVCRPKSAAAEPTIVFRPEPQCEEPSDASLKASII